MSTKRPFIWAHRGASGVERENTMSAFRKALELGADGVETDAIVTADEEIVLSHDGSVEVDGRKISIRSLTLQEIRNLLKADAIPTFGELLDVCTPRKIPISVDVRDLKTANNLGRLLEVRQAWFFVEICLDTLRNVKKIRELSEKAVIVFSPAIAWPPNNVVQLLSNNISLLVQNNVKAINFSWKYYVDHPDLFKLIHESGHMLAYAWDVHLKKQMQKVIPLNLDAIYTNYPDRLRALYDTMNH